MAATGDRCNASDDNNLAIDLQERCRFQWELQRYIEIYRRRRHFFSSKEHQSGKAYKRLFILSESEEQQPWRVFGQRTWMQIHKCIYEKSGLHFTLLHDACVRGDPTLMRHLLRRRLQQKHDMCTLARDSSGRIALHHAVIGGHLRIVKLLLQHHDGKLQVHTRDNTNRTAFHYVLEKMEILAWHRFPGVSPSHITVRMRRECKRYRKLWKVADEMLGMFALSTLKNIHLGLVKKVSLKNTDCSCRGDLWDACHFGDLKRLQILIKVYYSGECREWLSDKLQEFPFQMHELNRTLLHEACEQQHISIVHFLLTDLSHPRHLQDLSGCSPLHYAAKNALLEVCVMLLEEDHSQTDDFDPESLALCQDFLGRTALHWCLLAHDSPALSRSETITPSRSLVAKYLARYCPSTLHLHDNDKLSALHVAIWRGDLNLVAEFISLGASVNVPCMINGNSTSDSNSLHCISAMTVGDGKLKAAWAPCGYRFQNRDKKRTKIRYEAIAVPDIAILQETEKLERRSVRCVDIKKRNPTIVCDNDTEKLLSLETLKYWIPVHYKQKSTSIQADSALPTPLEVTKDESGDSSKENGNIGCKKYGGVCRACTPELCENEDYTGCYGSLSPLEFAIRCCTLSYKNSLIFLEQRCRLEIVELLLINGANPDGSGDEVGNHSSIAEALSVYEQCPQLLPILLQNGARRITIKMLEQFCTLSSSGPLVEQVLIQLLEFDIEMTSPCILAMVFQKKCFELIKLLGRRNPPMLQCQASLSVWSIIHDGLLMQKRRRLLSNFDLDRTHVLFVLELMQQASEDRLHSDSSVYGQDRLGLQKLLRHCIDSSFPQWRRDLSVVEMKSTEHTVHEQLLMNCLKQLLHEQWITDSGSALEADHISSTYTSWLEHMIIMGYYKCALLLIEAQVRSGSSLSLEEVLRYCLSARQHWRFQYCTSEHEAFLMTVIDKASQMRSQSSRKLDITASVDAVLYACALSLSLAAIEQVNQLITHNLQEVNGERTLLRRSHRVQGKLLTDWLLVHERQDVIHYFLCRSSAHTDRVLLWRDFVGSAVAIYCGKIREKHKTQWLEWLFTEYNSFMGERDFNDDEEEVLTWLLLKRAIPLDCRALFLYVFKLCAQHRKREATETMEMDDEWLVAWMTKINFIHELSRWNAYRILEYCLEHFYTSISWKQFWSKNLHRRHKHDECTPVELSQLLGHAQLYCALLSIHNEPKKSADEIDGNSHIPETDYVYGLFRTMMASATSITHDVNQTNFQSDCRLSTIKRTRNIDHMQIFTGDWASACALNIVYALQAFVDHRLQLSMSYNILHLLNVSIEFGALNAVQWILDNLDSLVCCLSQSEKASCLAAASRHTGDVYAAMTILLLEKGFCPGRLSGDGLDVTLLHRAVCFTNSGLAKRVMSILLAMHECDANVLDGFGQTPLAFALATGCVENAVFLIQHATTRLEGEFEGQSCFYYMLHIVPSFALRSLIQNILMTQRQHAFLHCRAEERSCACKGFERSTNPTVEAADAITTTNCDFCGHMMQDHVIVPYPPWFVDQYETYRSPQMITSHKGQHVNEDDEINGDGSRTLTNDIVSPEELENDSGRLNLQLLRVITRIKYGSLLGSYSDTTEDPDESDYEEESVDGDESAKPSNSSNSGWTMLQESTLSNNDDEVSVSNSGHEEYFFSIDHECIMMEDDTLSLPIFPWFLKNELLMLHPLSCTCRNRSFITRPSMQLYAIISKWLLHTAKRFLDAQANQLPTTTLEQAFQKWLLIVPNTQPAEKERAIFSLRTIKPEQEHTLRKFLVHWRYAHVWIAFHHWKHLSESYQVVHHRLEAMADAITSQMRQQRFFTLQRRQHQLEQSIRTTFT